MKYVCFSPAIKKNILQFKKMFLILYLFKRASSSAGLEHLPYKQRVGSSTLSSPTKNPTRGFFVSHAGVAELADALDSKSSGLITREGSTPSFCTEYNLIQFILLI